MKIKSYILILLLLSSFSYGQVEKYDYKRELIDISEQWHNLVLPNEIYGKISQNLSDIRIYGITRSNDTIEAPYLIRKAADEISNKEVAFKMLNTSHNDNGYYFTFEVPTKESINQIKLDFKQTNFDWKLKLEGSQNQQEWFTVSDSSRILSIKNKTIDFKFTKLTFPSSKYRFFRIIIDSKDKPTLISASVSQHKLKKGTYRDYLIKNINIEENKKFKQTEIEIELPRAVPVSYINLNISDSFDYCRPITIQYLRDSSKTKEGWKYRYSTLTSSNLNSIEKNEFKFNSTTTKNLKIIIHNNDNQPLAVNSIQAKGYVHKLTVRFTKPANYFLVYGRKNTRKPYYDIERFMDKIPTKMTAIQLGQEIVIEKDAVQVVEPLFQNKYWLWLIMAVIILVLGWFTLNMLRKS